MYAPANPLGLAIDNEPLIDWYRANGIDPNTVLSLGQHWTSLDDGTFALHYLEFILDENGKRIVCPSAEDDYLYGEHATYVKRPRLVRVNSRPDCTVEVAR